jgi:hypothetical protein
MIELILFLLALAAGVVAGMAVQRKLSIAYKQRWLDAVALLQEHTTDPDPLEIQVARAAMIAPAGVARAVVPAAPADARPYVHGKWALWEKPSAKGSVEFVAIRPGFDDIALGSAKTALKGLYRMTRENAEQAVRDMNGIK